MFDLITDLSEGTHHLALRMHFPGVTREQLFACFTEPQKLTRWWPPDAAISPKVGGDYTFTWPEQQWTLYGIVEVFDPGHRFQFSWNWRHEPDLPERHVACDFSDGADGATLLLTHGDYGTTAREQEDRDSHRSGWEYFLGQLAKHLAKPAALPRNDGLRPHGLFQMLENFPMVLQSTLDAVPEEFLTWRPADGGWSIIEIVGHLVDEETLDFRSRLFSTLEDPSRPWAPINPPETVKKRNHQEANILQLLGRFELERATSLDLLLGLQDPDWMRTHQHPRIGPISAADLLVSWAAHDALHLRQIGKRLYELAVHFGGGVGRAEYAGPPG